MDKKNLVQKKCVIYTRTATTEQAVNGHSLENQKRLCQEWAKKNDL